MDATGHAADMAEEKPTDSRAWQLDVTDDGAAVAVRAIAIVEAADAAFFASATGLGSLTGFLRTLAGEPKPGDPSGAAGDVPPHDRQRVHRERGHPADP